MAISSVFVFSTSASATEIEDIKVISTQKEVANENLVKIDTSEAGGGELYVDLFSLKNFHIVIDKVGYIIENGKLVKNGILTSQNKVTPFNDESYIVTLNNGQTWSKVKQVKAGTIMVLETHGDPERRELSIYSGEIMVVSYTGSSYGVSVVAEAPYTSPHYFNVTHYAAAQAQWRIIIYYQFLN